MTDKPRSFIERQNEVLALFADAYDDLDRYTVLIALGGMLEQPDVSFMTDDRLVKGCQSQVWLDLARSDGTLELTAYSDTLIVRGLLYILRECINGATAGEFLSGELFVFERAGVSDLLSPTRRSGLSSIISEIRRQAE
ncbi:MAG: SufE family protein [Oscillospiraceae bacterium]|nr:SufE family protein [Oscillospiraceae bacterium]